MHDLLLISYWHEFLDIVFFYKAVNNLVFIGSEALPATGQSTRSTRALSSNAITYILSEVGLLLRIINNSHFNAHTDPIFKDLGILKFNDIHLLQLGQFMYSCKNSFLPPKFNNKFSQSNQFHSYNTRHSQAHRLPYCRTNTKTFSPFFQGPIKSFNSLDNKVINSQSLSSFKKKLKIKLLSKYENSL